MYAYDVYFQIRINIFKYEQLKCEQFLAAPRDVKKSEL